MTKKTKSIAPKFKSESELNAEIGNITFRFSQENFNSEDIDDYVTQYVGSETGELVGFVLKNVPEVLKKIASKVSLYDFVTGDGEVHLRSLYTAMGAMDMIQGTKIATYLQLLEKAEEQCLDQIPLLPLMDKIEPAVAETRLNQYAIGLHDQLSQSNGFLFVGIGVQEGKPVFIVYVDQQYKNRFFLNITEWQNVPIVTSYIQSPAPAATE